MKIKILFVALLFGVVPVAHATSKKPVSAKKTLKKVLKNLFKTKGYSLNIGVWGGTSTHASHAITSTAYNASWAGDVNRGFFHVVTPFDGYRNYKTSTLSDSTRGGWAYHMASKDSRQFYHLAKMPEEILTMALKSKGNVTWGEKATSSLGKFNSPNNIRVLAPDKDAVRWFKTIQLSSCVEWDWGISNYLSRARRPNGNVTYEIELDKQGRLPVRILVTVVNSIREYDRLGKEHTVFKFTYDLTFNGEVKPLEIPHGAFQMLK